MSRYDELGAKIPRCGAKIRCGARCEALPAPHPRNPAYFVASGRCQVHGGASTGPRTAEGKARISSIARQMWATAFEAQGKAKPTDALRAKVEAFLAHCTWEQAIRSSGMSRRTLLRIERGGYCDEAELSAIQLAIDVPDELGVRNREAEPL